MTVVAGEVGGKVGGGVEEIGEGVVRRAVDVGVGVVGGIVEVVRVRVVGRVEEIGVGVVGGAVEIEVEEVGVVVGVPVLARFLVLSPVLNGASPCSPSLYQGLSYGQILSGQPQAWLVKKICFI